MEYLNEFSCRCPGSREDRVENGEPTRIEYMFNPGENAIEILVNSGKIAATRITINVELYVRPHGDWHATIRVDVLFKNHTPYRMKIPACAERPKIVLRSNGKTIIESRAWWNR